WRRCTSSAWAAALAACVAALGQHLAGGCPLRSRREQQALVAWPLATAPYWLATTGRARGAAAPAGSRPFAGGPWLQPVAPLQVADRPIKGAGRGHARLPLARASFAAKT
ncbi:hypothetical protein BHM03_00060104, partial [Ensete ventricosum]